MQFTRRLADNLRDALRAEGVEARVRGDWNRTYIETDDPKAADVACRVYGVQSVSVGEERPWSTMEDLVAAGETIFRPHVAGKQFAVRARRLGKSRAIPFTSMDLQAALGAVLQPHSAGVNLSRPEVTAYVEINTRQAIFFPDRQTGPGGIPLGAQGRALALVSGGFDSAVAAWMMLRRGVALDYLFLNLGGGAHEEGVLRVMKVIADRWSYGYRPRLFAVELRPFVEAMQETIRPRYLQVVLKRMMLHAGARLVRQHNLLGLVTGEAVGQVSSQTLPNLTVIDAAVDMSVFRPLVGFHKEEILDRAHALGTFDISKTIPEFCALTPSQPATRAGLKAVEAEEQKLDLATLDQATDQAFTYDLRSLDLTSLSRSDLALDHIPDHATILDLRPLHLYRKGHHPRALHLDYRLALEALPALDPALSYVLYCEVGFKSAFLASTMRDRGFTAHHVQGGWAKVRG